MKLPELNSQFDENKIYQCPNCGRIESGIILKNLICLDDESVRCKCDKVAMYLYHESSTRFMIK